MCFSGMWQSGIELHWNRRITFHDDFMKWKHFPRYWPFVRGIHRSPVNSPHKGQWRGALMFSLIWAWINGWVKNREAGDLRRHRANSDITVMHTIAANPDCLRGWWKKTNPRASNTNPSKLNTNVIHNFIDMYFDTSQISYIYDLFRQLMRHI